MKVNDKKQDKGKEYYCRHQKLKLKFMVAGFGC